MSCSRFEDEKVVYLYLCICQKYFEVVNPKNFLVMIVVNVSIGVGDLISGLLQILWMNSAFWHLYCCNIYFLYLQPQQYIGHYLMF
jgi:hypothetical protein